ncbi:allophanate hydrolase [Winogradskya humida]|uniref:Amidase n=1 Tax=Winogradskya humida TaxID=113566 RepID=A0ABQ4A2M1_9ACTN|nr:allophanate hydrolase [Actinoplanes humidus]GIE25096.1 amidase [Actinoplanes humidus]
MTAADRVGSRGSGAGSVSAVVRDRMDAALALLAAADRPEIWISLRSAADLTAEATLIDERVAAGEHLPLAGMLLAVKDNIDVAGLDTTAGAPSYAYSPAVDAPAVARLRAAGAIVLGKTNLDQFATGLVGTRSPHGAVRNAWDLTRISGGSSSGSAVAVALGIADLALGTDTAGSGRVPAALNGIWGFKPTRGRIPATGVVPACRSIDCVTVFSREPSLGRLAVALMTGPDAGDMLSRPFTVPARPPVRRIAVPPADELGTLAPGWADAFTSAIATLPGVEVTEVSIAPLLDAAKLLYGGAFVAERYSAVGAHIAAHPELVGTGLDATVAGIVLAGRDPSAVQLFDDLERLDTARAAARDLLAGYDAILTPTTTGHPTLAEVAADPIGANAALGRFTNYANLLDLSAVALPAGTVNGLPFGLMLTGAAFDDERLADFATLISDALRYPAVELAVFGAHLSGQPLNHQLTSVGGRLVRGVRTTEGYRMFALATTPPKPGLVRVADGGTSVTGELWSLPAAAFGAFVAALPAPMAIGTVELSDGTAVTGFLCETVATEGAEDISAAGSWPAYLAGR